VARAAEDERVTYSF
jgi:hypothetical protein